MNVFCQTGWKQVLSAMIGDNLVKRIRLFKNNHIPATTDTTADYTQADFGGYIGVQNVTWGAPFINGSVEGEVDADPVTWTCDGSAPDNTIYGIYVTDITDVLTYAERFDAPILMADAGAFITYAPKVTDVNQ